jgi:CDP-diacylglycerol--serine O-phosphatidyltransferase
MIMDALDGRLARLTQSQTAFGAEYDSLSDMVAFGVAPSLVVYKWSLTPLGEFGWLLAFIYTAAVALRLARFNTQVKNQDKHYFQGLSCTAAAGMIASLVWFGHHYELMNMALSILNGALVLLIATLMVSNIRYRSFKDVDPKGPIPFFMLLIIVLVFAAIAIDPPTVLLLLFFAYGLSGPILTLHRLRQAQLARRQLRSRKVDKSPPLDRSK